MLACILITFVLLPSISYNVFQSFSCNEEFNTLNADPMVVCDSDVSPEYTTIKLLGWLGFFIYPFGVPILYLHLLGNHFGPSRKEFKDWFVHVITGRALADNKQAADGLRRGNDLERVNENIKIELEKEEEEQKRLFALEKSAPRYLAALSEEFEPQWWWIPVFEQYRKMAITGATILIGRGEIDQLVIGILIGMVATLVYFATMPYKDFNDDMFSMFTHFQIFLVLLWSLLVKFQKLLEVSHIEGNGNLDDYEAPTTLLETHTLGWLLILSNLSVLLVFIGFLTLELKTVKKSVNAWKKWDKIKAKAFAQGWSEESVLDEMGEGLSNVDRDSILNKWRARKMSESESENEGKGIEMKNMDFVAENPMAKAHVEVKGRPFGGLGVQESVRHLSEADPVGLGAAEVTVSKHQKYAQRAKEEGKKEEVEEEVEVDCEEKVWKGKSYIVDVAKGDIYNEEGEAIGKWDDRNGPKLHKTWETHFDESHNAEYYVHKVTNTTVWEKPDDV